MSAATGMYSYVVRFGDEEPRLLPDDLGAAQEYLHLTISDMQQHLPGWRLQALENMVDGMPRAGFSFFVPQIGTISVWRERV